MNNNLMTTTSLEETLSQVLQLLKQQRGVRKHLADFEVTIDRPYLSFISPCYNERENLVQLHSRIASTCDSAGIKDFEIVWVENGSSDGSFEVMSQISASDPRVKVLQLSRNFGYQGAIACGLAYASGKYVSILDGDLQDPPELITQMLNVAVSAGHQVVYGVRTKRQEHFFKKLAYKSFYRLWKVTAEIDVPLDAGDFCVMSREVVNAINNMPERQRFNRGLRAWVGFSQSGFNYERNSRAEGISKFNLRGMIQLALDGLISYSIVPLRFAAFFGLAVAIASIALGAIQGVARLIAYQQGSTFSGVLPPGITQISLVMIGLFGVQFCLMGVMGEYIGRIYGEVKDRPLFLLKNTIGF